MSRVGRKSCAGAVQAAQTLSNPRRTIAPAPSITSEPLSATRMDRCMSKSSVGPSPGAIAQDEAPTDDRRARLLARAKRNQLRMMRGILAAEMRDFQKLQRQKAREHRQRHPCKETRAIRSLMHELARVAAHGPAGEGAPHRTAPPELRGALSSKGRTEPPRSPRADGTL